MKIQRLFFHLTPEKGFMNDPNGLYMKNGIYNIYFQYAPDYPKKVNKEWGHFATRNFIKYAELPSLIKPDTPNDKNGAYSGTAYPSGGEVRLYYTGNVRNGAKRKQYVILARTKNGTTLFYKKKILGPKNYPKDIGEHIRDPHVFLYNTKYYMVLGAGTKSGGGVCLVFSSKDGESFTFCGRTANDTKNYMYECVQYIEGFLLFCPQSKCGDNVISQSVYARIHGSITNKEIVLGKQIPLDYGFDFYAPQCCFDGARYILFAWLSNPTAGYLYEEQQDGYVNCLSIPRIINFTKRGVTQKPLPELKKLRGRVMRTDLKSGDYVTLESRSFELYILPKSKNFKIIVRGAIIEGDKGKITVSIMSGGRKSATMPYYGKSIRVFCDTSSIEIFSSGRSFSSRIYFGEPQISVDEGEAFLRIWRLRPITLLRKEENYENI